MGRHLIGSPYPGFRKPDPKFGHPIQNIDTLSRVSNGFLTPVAGFLTPDVTQNGGRALIGYTRTLEPRWAFYY